jgi:hypothetical protein
VATIPPTGRSAVVGAIKRAQEILPEAFTKPEHARFLDEIAAVETEYGGHPNTYREGYHGGMWQMDEAGFLDTQDVESHRKNLEGWHKKIEERTGIKWGDLTWEDLRDNPTLGALAARLKLLNDPDPIPEDVAGRAEYWKRVWNSYHENAAGTPDHYISQLLAQRPKVRG